MSEVSQFQFLYRGVKGPGAVELRELVQVLKGVDGVLSTSATLLHGGDAKVDTRIHAIRPGSIDISGAVSIISGLQPAFALMPMLALHAKDIFSLIKIWIEIQKHLKGSPPQSVTLDQSKENIVVTNCNNVAITVNRNTYNTFVVSDVPKKLARLRSPFEKGAESLILAANGHEIARVGKKDAHSLRPITFSDDVATSEIDIILDVKGPVFEGSNQWRFRLGRNTITAAVNDNDFLSKVLDGQESFKNGDRIQVRLKTKQTAQGRRIKTVYEITRVLARM